LNGECGFHGKLHGNIYPPRTFPHVSAAAGANFKTLILGQNIGGLSSIVMDDLAFFTWKIQTNAGNFKFLKHTAAGATTNYASTAFTRQAYQWVNNIDCGGIFMNGSALQLTRVGSVACSGPNVSARFTSSNGLLVTSGTSTFARALPVIASNGLTVSLTLVSNLSVAGTIVSAGRITSSNGLSVTSGTSTFAGALTASNGLSVT
jgi:hypothetical protein